MTGTVLIEAAPGELIDKITILEIKNDRISDPQKLKNVRIELAALQATRDDAVPVSQELTAISRRLREVNEALWVIEDDIRDCERDGDFGPRFVELARSVYKTNDVRAALKKEINTLLGSRIVEEKSYTDY
ncbi:MAG: DUF6165 family protein [Pseudomonadota bacterium]